MRRGGSEGVGEESGCVFPFECLSVSELIYTRISSPSSSTSFSWYFLSPSLWLFHPQRVQVIPIDSFLSLHYPHSSAPPPTFLPSRSSREFAHEPTWAFSLSLTLLPLPLLSVVALYFASIVFSGRRRRRLFPVQFVSKEGMHSSVIQSFSHRQRRLLL